jgi:hypothetical protein
MANPDSADVDEDDPGAVVAGVVVGDNVVVGAAVVGASVVGVVDGIAEVGVTGRAAPLLLVE